MLDCIVAEERGIDKRVGIDEGTDISESPPKDIYLEEGTRVGSGQAGDQVGSDTAQ